jgi:hypothetical protein
MARKKFKFSHSIVGLLGLLLLQGILVWLWPIEAVAWLILCLSAVGAMGLLYVATEVVEEIRNANHMIAMLFAVSLEFVIFFACEYGFLIVISPSSFPSLPPDLTSLLLHSTMVFVFNPLYLPATALGRMLLLINTASSMGLVLFVLQNVAQIRRSAQ